MSKYDIYELMGEYADEEFAPERDNSADVKAVRKRVGEQVKMPRRHIKLKAALAVAAVTAIACTGAAISATPNDGITTMYVSMLTRDIKLIFEQNEYHNGLSIDYGDRADIKYPLEVRDGRLWFVADGQNFDITDMIDMETPYIYKTVNPDTGLADWLIVGGTPEYFGFYEFMKYGEGKDYGDCDCGKEFCWHCTEVLDCNDNNWIDIYTIDGVDIPAYKMTEEEREQAWEMSMAGEAVFTCKNTMWMANAADEFGYPNPVGAPMFDPDYVMFSTVD